MNEPRYFLFWMYNLDLHNLDIEGLAGCVPDPRCDFRWKQFEIHQIDMKNLPSKQIMDELVNQFSEVNFKENV